MPESAKLVKAELQEIDLANPEAAATKKVPVQFNPESLKVSFANQIQTPEGSGDQRGTPTQQFVGAGTTKLTLQLWFDVNAEQDGEAVLDVRKMTEKISYFITPKANPKDKKKFIPPGIRFIWGSFQFDGLMESLEESLEFFSTDGIPLRASMTLNLTQQKIDIYKFGKDAPSRMPLPGTRPLTEAPQGETVQNMAANQGKADDWQSVAASNGIENPRSLPPGQFLDLNVTAGLTAGIGNVPLFHDLGAPANLSVQTSLEGQTNLAAQASFGTE
jgi:Contractile injection system tube protein